MIRAGTAGTDAGKTSFSWRELLLKSELGIKKSELSIKKHTNYTKFLFCIVRFQKLAKNKRKTCINGV